MQSVQGWEFHHSLKLLAAIHLVGVRHRFLLTRGRKGIRFGSLRLPFGVLLGDFYKESIRRENRIESSCQALYFYLLAFLLLVNKGMK
jgi:hypothetical protein